MATQPSWPPAIRNVLIIAGTALLVRLLFFVGYMGSDEVVYVDGAAAVLRGDVQPTNYIGALRYGVDIPVALFLWLFGLNVAAASMWGMLGSITDVVVVFACALLLWGLRAATFAGIVVAFLPLHVNLAGRMLADPPLVAFISLSVLCFIIGNRRDSSGWFFFSGLAVGASFWVKQATILYVLVFPMFALAGRTWNWRWLWAAVGAVMMLIANCLVIWAYQGDPLHVFKVTGEGLDGYGAQIGIDDSAWVYFRYLFLDLRHTWLLAYLAVIGTLYGLKAPTKSDQEHPLLYAGVWAASLLLIFSFTVISAAPLRLIMKQSNYMVLFTAPLCLLAGYGLSRMTSKAALVIAALYVAGGVILAGLAQQDIHVFRANSAPALAYAREHPQAAVYATTNAYHLAVFERALSVEPTATMPVKPLSALTADGDADKGRQRLAVVDVQNLHWGRNPLSRVDQIPSCWRRIEQLQHAPLTSAGSHVVSVVAGLVSLLPQVVAGSVLPKLEPLAKPKPAFVYEIPNGCGLPIG